MKSRFGEDVTITPGKSGQFDVLVGGSLIFSKSEAGRFPDDGEVEDRFDALKAGKELPPIAAKPGPLRRIVDRLRG